MPVGPAGDADERNAESSATRAWDVPPFAVVDGGLSTALELAGYRVDGLLWTARLVVEEPDAIVQAHRSFVDAGADVVISASYQASEGGFAVAGCSPAEARRALASTTELARRSGAAVVACSVGPFGATLGDGSEYHGHYAASWADVRSFHRDRLAVLADTGPDLFAIETIPSCAEAEIILDELAAVTATPAWVTFACRDARSTCAGDAMGDAVASVAAGASRQVIAVGVNCTAPDHVGPLLELAAARTDRPLVAYPNHGRAWDAVDECWIGEPHDGLTDHLASWVATGARFVGGCCGVGPDGVRAIVAARRALTSRA